MTSDFMALVSTIGTLVLMIAVFVGAYYTSKVVGTKYQGSKINGKSNIDIIERKAIGKDQAIVIVKVCDKVVLLGVTHDNIQKIDTLDPEAFLGYEPPEPARFTNILKDAINKNKKNKENFEGDTYARKTNK